MHFLALIGLLFDAQLHLHLNIFSFNRPGDLSEILAWHTDGAQLPRAQTAEEHKAASSSRSARVAVHALILSSLSHPPSLHASLFEPPPVISPSPLPG